MGMCVKYITVATPYWVEWQNSRRVVIVSGSLNQNQVWLSEPAPPAGILSRHTSYIKTLGTDTQQTPNNLPTKSLLTHGINEKMLPTIRKQAVFQNPKKSTKFAIFNVLHI